MVARDRDDRRLDAAEQPHGPLVELRGADVDQIAREDDQLGMQGVDRVDDACELPLGGDDRAEVHVRELHDAHAVESGGQARRADLHAADVHVRAAKRGAPDERRGDAAGEHDARAAEVQQPEQVADEPRQHGEHPDPYEPHHCGHVAGRVVAHDKSGQRHRNRNEVRCAAPEHPERGDAPVLLPQAAEAEHVGDDGQDAEQGYDEKKKHRSYFFGLYIR